MMNLPPPSPRQRLTPLRVEHDDPRDRLLMLYGVWVKCLPHQAGKRALVERCIEDCKRAIAQRESQRRRRYGIGNAPKTPAVGQKILVPFEGALYRARVVDVDATSDSVWVDSSDWVYVRHLPTRSAR